MAVMDKISKWNNLLTLVTAAAAVLGLLIGGARLILVPWFVTAASKALSGNIDSRIDGKTAPVKAGIESILNDKITELQGQVDLLHARRQRDPSKWTDLDVLTLTQAEQRLANARAALANFLSEEAQSKRFAKGD
jgi:hypothetical protein